MSKEIQNNCAMHFPFIMENSIEYNVVGDHELVIKTKDGNLWSYYDLTGTIRKLPQDCSDLSEEQCKNEFGIRLRRIMELKGITQAALAKLVGVDQPSISKYVNGKWIPSFFILDKIARVLDCSMDEFRYRRGK